MKRATFAALALALLATGCAHPEDRRWSALEQSQRLTGDDLPSVSVYAFAPPKPSTRTGLGALSDHGQAALIEAYSRTPAGAEALRKALNTPLEGEGSSGSVDRSRLSRTIVISVRKGNTSQPGDRLMRTVVTITPRRLPGDSVSPFEFAGYTVAATDTKVQNIAKLETTSEASLSASLAPEIGGFGDNSVSGELSRSHTTSADIVQQYENLGIDIRPTEMVVTRESERGLDVVGNTLVALTLAANDTDRASSDAVLAGRTTLFEKGQPLAAGKATLELKRFTYLSRCAMDVDVTLHFQMRRITAGREYYTEGKQTVSLSTGSVGPVGQTLLRAQDIQTPLYVVQDIGTNSSVLAALFTSTPIAPEATRLLLFDSFEDATQMAFWLNAAQRSTIGTDGVRLLVGTATGPAALAAGARYRAQLYETVCPPDPPPAAK